MFVCLQESVAGAVGPTLPGGLVVRIRRSHRRGPGSIPGQGSFSSSSLHLHFPKPRSSPSLTFAQLRHTTPTATQVHPRLSTHARRRAPLHPPEPETPYTSFRFTLSLSACCPFLSHTTTPPRPLCSHTPTLHLSIADSLLTLETRLHTRPRHKRTFLTRGTDHKHSSTPATHGASTGLHLLIACSSVWNKPSS